MRINDYKKQGLYIRVTSQENKMIQELRRDYSTNVSQLVRNSIRDFYLKQASKKNGVI